MADILSSDFVMASINKVIPTQGSGDYASLSGVVTEQGKPVSRRVFCYLRRSGKLVGVTISDADGKYVFKNLSGSAKYFVTSIDENSDTTQYNAVTQDLVTANKVLI